MEKGVNEVYDLVVKGGTIVSHDGVGEGDIGVRGGRIAHIGGAIDRSRAGRVFEARGLHVLPGVIDSQVHFREPGLEHKEDFATGSRSAVLGGVTAVFDMPNTAPPTTDEAALADKMARARGRMHCDFAFYVGATADTIDQLPELERAPGSAGIKVFIGSSTGGLLVDDQAALEAIIARISRRAAFHCEDEARLRARLGLREPGAPASHSAWRDATAALLATRRLLDLARRAGKRIHVLHVSTAEEIELLSRHKDLATVELTPQHLTLTAPEAYQRLGTKAQMNPPLRDVRHQQALWEGLRQGVADVLATDHAPHTLEEKSRPYPGSPSGMPGVQTFVPIMLDHVNAGRLTLQRLVDLTSHGPQRVFGLAGKGRVAQGYDADLTLVDLAAERVIRDEGIASRCGWSPFAGRKVKGWPMATMVRGRVVMAEGEVVAPPAGEPVRFVETLGRDAV